MDYDSSINKKIAAVDDEKTEILQRLQDEGSTPQLAAQLKAIFDHANAMAYKRQRQADLDRATKQLSEAHEIARETHQAYMKARNS